MSSFLTHRIRGRSKPPTAQMLFGSGSVSSMCAWKVPCFYYSKGRYEVDTKDCVAFILPFRETTTSSMPRFAQDTLESADRNDCHAINAQKMSRRQKRLQMVELDACIQLGAYTDLSSLGPDTCITWMILSRFGNQLFGNHTDTQSLDDSKRAIRQKQTEDILGSCNKEWLALRATEIVQPFYKADTKQSSIQTTEGCVIKIGTIRFVGPIIELTPPGTSNITIACCITQEVQAKKH